MQSGSTKITLKIKRDQNGANGSALPDLMENTNQNPADLSSSDEEENCSAEDKENQPTEDAQKQLVVYDPSSNGAFTVQCAKCFKWRLIPTKEKYEEIRERILEDPFFCDAAREWRPDISCEDPPDISQDGSRLWAIDKPNIARPPTGWQRLLRIRGEGSYKFADVYYAAPSGKRLRSMVEVQKYLVEHPEFVEAGVKLSQFSFQTPKPLQDNYVRKRPKLTAADPNNGTTGLPEPSDVNPISWASPAEKVDLRIGGPGHSKALSESPSSETINRPKKRTKKPANESTSNNLVYDDQQKVKVDEPSKLATVDEPSLPVQEEELSQSINGGIDT